MYFSFVCSDRVMDILIILGLSRLPTYSSMSVSVGTTLGSLTPLLGSNNSSKVAETFSDELSLYGKALSFFWSSYLEDLSSSLEDISIWNFPSILMLIEGNGYVFYVCVALEQTCLDFKLSFGFEVLLSICRKISSALPSCCCWGLLEFGCWVPHAETGLTIVVCVDLSQLHLHVH